MKAKSCTIIGIDPMKLSFGYDEKHPKCIHLKIHIAETICKLFFQGYVHFYTNCEFGIPLWSAEAVLALKMFYPALQLHLVAPCLEQANKWTPEWRERYFKIHEQATSVKILNDKTHDSNIYLIDKTEILLSFDFKDSKNPVTEYASGQGKNVVNLLPFCLC